MNSQYQLLQTMALKLRWSQSGLSQRVLIHSVLIALCLCCLFKPVQAEPASVASTVWPDTGWRLDASGQYQQLSGESLAALLAEQPLFCQSPKPDTRPVLWDDANGHSQRWSFSNEGGVLRWWSGSSQRQLIWAEGTKLAPPAESLSNQLTVLATPTAPKRLTVVWPEPALQRYSAVDLTDPQKPQTLWQWQAPLAGSLQTPVPLSFKTATGARQAFVMVSGADAVQPGFWLVDAVSGKLLASQQYQRSVKTVELPFVLQDLVATPAVLDRNADGFTDRIYLVDTQGRLVQADLDPQLQMQSRVVADLADATAQFKVQLVASRALLPDAQLVATATTATSVNEQDATSSGLDKAAGTAGQSADVVILLSSKNEQSQLWVLIIPDSPAYTIQPHHLTERDIQTNDIAESITSTATAGWYGVLPAAPVFLPQVLAGVLYLPVDPVAETCAGARQARQLVARHLFQGSPIYSAAQLAAIPAPFGLPAAIRRSSGELALQDLQPGSLLLPQILGIRADCRFCTEVLHQSDYPKWQRMAIYQHESEVYR